ncbi:SMP-30/gluconolactonase/LRE family protein [Roseobacter litoralis]|uniref:SMP-30/gluconolactonase/LRE family protein n=1 Tax=Roseobacter litoralis TaxID=42443 RepID=UPI0024910D74|nr:SMP-30/gluconolactonase/LRE family protein [Roseobacter litoralis]
MTAQVHDARVCTLGEGALWHPQRRQLFWFDILENALLSRDDTGLRHWLFDETVSAAGWVDDKTLLVASATGLWQFDLRTQQRRLIAPLEQDRTETRPNDGRADPWGGFWISTMGRDAQYEAGAIYRYFKGSLRRLFGQITIPNAICFAPDKSCAYFTDTATQKVMRTQLNSDGWPQGEVSVFLDLTQDGLNPDGAQMDAACRIWIAMWGAGKVMCFNAQGQLERSISLPAQNVTCPAFGGDNMDTLFVTSSANGLPETSDGKATQHGMTFAINGVGAGLPEPQVIL